MRSHTFRAAIHTRSPAGAPPSSLSLTLRTTSGMAGPIDKTRFGTGYISDMEKADIFVFAGTEHFDKGGAGGAVPVRGYTGPWPTFGKPEDSWEQQGDVGWSTGEGSSSSSLSSSDTPVRRPRWMCKSTGRCSTCPPNEVSAG